MLPACSWPSVRLHNGVEVPSLAVGTFKLRDQSARDVVKWALESGYSHIDTASVYKNETEIGIALREAGVPRGSVFLTSKLSPYEHGQAAALAACEASLLRLGTNYLDLYLIHWPGVARKPPASRENAVIRMQTWRALEQLYSQGKCRAIGVSNYTVEHLRHMLPLCSVRPMVNQVELHPWLTQTELREFCAQEGIQVAAYSPLGCGQLLEEETVVGIATSHGRTPPEVLLQWSLAKGCVVVVKSSSKQRLAQNMGAVTVSLRPQEVLELDGQDRGHHFCWSPSKVA